MSRRSNRNKKRRFSIAKVKESLQSINSYEIEEQLNILALHVVVEKPTQKSACLVRDLSVDADTYLRNHCDFNTQQLAELKTKIIELTD